MLKAIISTWTLFFGLLLIAAGNGLQVVLLGTRAPEAGFSNIATGIVMSGYFAGIFAGSIIVPNILARVGHVRVFGAMSAIASAAVLLHVVFLDPFVWTGMRFASGFSFAGMYIVCESWLNEKATNETRGQLLSLYMITNMAGMAAGQLMISFGEAGGAGLFLLASVMVSIAVVPILITASAAPSFEAPERISFRRLVQVSPLAVVGMIFIGIVISMVFGMGAVYGRNIGLNNTQVGYFMTSITLGTLALQYPIGRLSDKFDRRVVIFGATVTGGIAIGIASLFGSDQFGLLLIMMLIFGGLVFSLYSLFIAHANDYLAPSQMVAMSSGLLMVNGAGAVIGSPLAASVIEIFGTRGFMPTIAGFLFLLAGFVLYRMKMRSAVPAEAQGAFVAIPEVSSGVAVNLSPEVEWVMSEDEDDDENDPFKNNPYVN
ncbi:MFS transporter [Alphaproteobacteria bacterium]|jgi:MFS family permease|nr:MFS transporter [Alphaproteobacteria bacterium]